MASLRSLLNVAPKSAIPTNATQPLRFNNTGNQVLFVPLCTIVMDTNYERQCFGGSGCIAWMVPTDKTVNCLIFEIWGGGGSGAGACCCSWGFPGGSGAYAKKALSSSTYGNMAGWFYCMCVSPPGCCSPAMSCGYRGCKSYVVGCGLSNFCVEGGIPGCSYCFLWTCMGCCVAPHFGWGATSCCACYWGADEGYPGRPGYLQNNECQANTCYYRNFLPVPGQIMSQCHGWIVKRMYDFNTTSSAESCGMANGHTGGQYTKTPGMGGASASAFGGNCYCGGPGGPGMIRITYY